METNKGGERRNAGRKRKYMKRRLMICVEEENKFIFEVNNKTEFINNLLKNYKAKELQKGSYL